MFFFLPYILIWYLPINFFCDCLLSLTVIEMMGVLWEVELLNVKCNIILHWRIGTKSNHNWITFYWVHIYHSYGKNRNQTKLWQLSFPCTELRLTIVKRYLTYSQSFNAIGWCMVRGLENIHMYPDGDAKNQAVVSRSRYNSTGSKHGRGKWRA